MTSLIYLSPMCSCGLFLRMGEGDRIYLQLLRTFFLGLGTEKRICQSVNRSILNSTDVLLCSQKERKSNNKTHVRASPVVPQYNSSNKMVLG